MISSVYGGYDQLLPPAVQDMPCEWVMVSDAWGAPDPWKTVLEPRPHLHPRMAAKIPKARPDWYTDADVTIWVDGNAQITDPAFVGWCVESLRGAHLAQHHSLNYASVAMEASCAGGMPKYGGQPLHEQAAHYTGAGLPEDYGVWWTGLIVRHRTCPDFGTPWLAEMARWTVEDQISQPYVLWQLGLKPAPLSIAWGPPDRFRLNHHRDQM